MPVQLRRTVGDVLEVGAGALRAAGVPAPRREALRLLADLLERAPAELAAWRAAAIAPAAAERFDAQVARRAAGEPLAYVTGLAGFRHLVLRSDRRALIPRPETEGLVDRVLALAAGGIVLDVGTGTGCVALALAHEGSFAGVVGIDRNPAALALAAENRRRTGLAIGLTRGDLTSAVRTGTVDAVVSNPPYLTEAEYLAVDRSVRDYEPAEALASGPDGLAATRALAADAGRVVRPGGWLVLEIAAERPDETAAVVAAAGWTGIHIEPDLFARPRYLTARWRNHD